MNYKILRVVLIVLSLVVSSFIVIAQENKSPAPSPIQEADGNAEVLELIKAGLGPQVIVAKIKASKGQYDSSPASLQRLKAAGATDEIIVAVVEASAPRKPESGDGSTNPRGRITDVLTTRFRELQTSVVTVWSEIGHGSGFIFDEKGLILTNQHVVGPSELVSVQFDPELKVAARVLALDPQRDVAVLWIDLSTFPGATVAKLAKSTQAEPSLVEGERVMTIGSPLNQRKVMTTGIASKIEAHAIISDVNINHGNSGGPLFNSLGEVVGITTFGDLSNQGGPGISGIVKIEEAMPVIELARGKMSLTEKPDPRTLPVDPTDTYPLEAIKEVVEAKKFDYDPYLFGVGDYEVVTSTPLFQYRRQTEAEREAEKTKSSRTKNKDSIKNSYKPIEEFKNWAEYVGEYKPVLIIQAQPKMAESFWSAMNRGIAANYGIRTPANLHFKSDFYRMKLFCGEKEIEPIHPSKVFFLTNERTAFVRSNDATYVGLYAYPPDAVTTQCSTVRVEIFSEKHPDKAESKVLEKKTVNRIVEDFAPYFRTKQ